jgi:hypothetical protein
MVYGSLIPRPSPHKGIANLDFVVISARHEQRLIDMEVNASDRAWERSREEES